MADQEGTPVGSTEHGAAEPQIIRIYSPQRHRDHREKPLQFAQFDILAD
jgi:hypothetical protein